MHPMGYVIERLIDTHQQGRSPDRAPRTPRARPGRGRGALRRSDVTAARASLSRIMVRPLVRPRPSGA